MCLPRHLLQLPIMHRHSFLRVLREKFLGPTLCLKPVKEHSSRLTSLIFSEIAFNDDNVVYPELFALLLWFPSRSYTGLTLI